MSAQNDGEITDKQLQALVLAQTQSIEQLSSLVSLIKKAEAFADICKAEEDRIAAMRKTAANRVERIRKFLVPYVREKKSVQVGLVKLGVRDNKFVDLDDGFNNPLYMRVPPPPKEEPDKTVIMDELKAGKVIPGARIGHNYTLTIK